MMRLSSLLIVVATFSVAAVLALVTANLSVTLIEENSEIGVRDALDEKGMTWAEVEADGLQVTLAGIAPTEAIRFAALSTAGTIVDAARVIEQAFIAQHPLRSPADKAYKRVLSSLARINQQLGRARDTGKYYLAALKKLQQNGQVNSPLGHLLGHNVINLLNLKFYLRLQRYHRILDSHFCITALKIKSVTDFTVGLINCIT